MSRTKRIFLLLSPLLALALVLALLSAATWLLPSTSRQSSGAEIWFDYIGPPLSISAQDEEALVRSVAEAVLDRAGTRIELPPALRGDNLPRIVFLSVSDGKSPARVILGSGSGLGGAVTDALEQALSASLNPTATVTTADRPAWVKLDIAQEVVPLENVDASKPLGLERSLYGLASDESTGVAFLPEVLVTYTLVNNEQKIQPENIQAYLAESPGSGSKVEWNLSGNQARMYRFTTASSFSDGQEVARLYRGHRRFDQASSQEIALAARRGGEYLTRSVGADGKFVYSYLPKSGIVVEEYNILRHAGSIYAMMELYRVTGDKGTLQAARRAIGYLLRAVERCPLDGQGSASCVVEDGDVKLGGNALAVIALAKYAEVTGDRQYVPVMLDLGRWIESTQSESGEFTIQIQSYPDGNVDDFESAYYPGEAMLAMVRMYALDRNETWLDVAEAGADYLINVRDKEVPDVALPHDHWLLYALNELYRYRPNPLYVRHSLRLADAIVKSQNDGAEYPDWAGSYYQPPRSTPAATRTEGLCAAYSLARDFGYAREADTMLAAMWRSAAFQLRTQFGPESALYLNNPQQALGGFRESLTDFEIRIDFVQHNISSLLCLNRVSGSASTNDGG